MIRYYTCCHVQLCIVYRSGGFFSCLTWWRHQMVAFSALQAICVRNSPVPGQRPVTQSFDVFFDLVKRLSKQSWGWWCETLSHPLWRHCNGHKLSLVWQGVSCVIITFDNNFYLQGHLVMNLFLEKKLAEILHNLYWPLCNFYIFGNTAFINIMKTCVTCNDHRSCVSRAPVVGNDLYQCNLAMVLLKSLRWRHNGRDDVSNHQSHDCLPNHLFRSKKTLQLHVTGLCAGNSPFTGEFPAQRASNAENISIWLRHHEWKISICNFLHCFAHTGSTTRNVACNSLIRATCATEVVTLITSGAASDDNSVKITFPSMEKVHAMFLVVQWCDFRLAWSAYQTPHQ